MLRKAVLIKISVGICGYYDDGTSTVDEVLMLWADAIRSV